MEVPTGRRCMHLVDSSKKPKSPHCPSHKRRTFPHEPIAFTDVATTASFKSQRISSRRSSNGSADFMSTSGAVAESNLCCLCRDPTKARGRRLRCSDPESHCRETDNGRARSAQTNSGFEVRTLVVGAASDPLDPREDLLASGGRCPARLDPHGFTRGDWEWPRGSFSSEDALAGFRDRFRDEAVHGAVVDPAEWLEFRD